MKKSTYRQIESHMLRHMNDSAHDSQHIYRVLYYALDIARGETVDLDVLIAAALLHDIGRQAEYSDPKADHAAVGAEMAYSYLVEAGWEEGRAMHVRSCISTHRYRGGAGPESLEARILFDADKLDAAGIVGIARTIMYKGIVGQPLYAVDEEGRVSSGVGDSRKSVFQEYNWKLKNVYGKFHTKRAALIAESRRQAAAECYERLYSEVSGAHNTGLALLGDSLEQ